MVLGPGPATVNTIVELRTATGAGTGMIHTSWSQPFGGEVIDEYVVQWTLEGLTSEVYQSEPIFHLPGKTDYEHTSARLTQGAFCNVTIITKNQRSDSHSPWLAFFIGE